jgi:hypothetical protein
MNPMLFEVCPSFRRIPFIATSKYMHICAYMSTLIDGIRSKEWRAQGDDFRTFLAHFVEALPQIDFPAGLLP